MSRSIVQHALDRGRVIGVGPESRQPEPLEFESRETPSRAWFATHPGAPVLPNKGRATNAQLVLELPRTSEAPGIARRWLAESFAEKLDSLARQKAKLLVSELVTNAVIHGRGRMEVRAQLDRDRLLVEVIDEGPGFTPTVREPHPDIAGGNGFRIVEEEARRWGIRGGAAHVWFELARHPQGADRATSGLIPNAHRPGQEPNPYQSGRALVNTARFRWRNPESSERGPPRSSACATRAGAAIRS